MEKGTGFCPPLSLRTLWFPHYVQVITFHGSLKAAHGGFSAIGTNHYCEIIDCSWHLRRYSADDESVTETSPGQVAAAQAYILFYCSTVLQPTKA